MQRARPVGRAILIGACAAAAALSIARIAGLAVPAWLLAAAALGVVAVVAAGVGWLASGVFARPILGAHPARAAGRIALTFDDGPDPVETPRVLAALESRGHRGTFFVIGARAERAPELVAEIVRRGHGLGNHSHAHSWLTPMRGTAALTADLVRAGDVLERAAGVRPRWFRPPIGLISPPVAAAAARARLELVGWTVSARDGTAATSVERSLSRLLAGLRPGAILVLHDAVERGGRRLLVHDLLPRLLDAAEARGLRSVPLDELLAE